MLSESHIKGLIFGENDANGNKAYRYDSTPSADTVPVAAGFAVRSVESVDQKAGIIVLNVWLRMKWHDQRLAYSRFAGSSNGTGNDSS